MTGLTWRRWVALCAAAEGIGMTAAASAAKGAQGLVDDAPDTSRRLLSLGLIVCGGLVEGSALGLLQGRGLAPWLPGLDRWRWAWVTTVVAGLGWAAASAPAALSASDDAGADPPMVVMVAGGAGLGMVMGALLGAAQTPVLRGQVSHPRRWITASAVSWGPAMAVVFVGAGTPAKSWSGSAVAALGTATGLLAGAVLGAVSGWFLPSLDGPAQSEAGSSRSDTLFMQ